MKMQVKCNLKKSYIVIFEMLKARKHSCAVILSRLHRDVTWSSNLITIPDYVTLCTPNIALSLNVKTPNVG